MFETGEAQRELLRASVRSEEMTGDGEAESSAPGALGGSARCASSLGGGRGRGTESASGGGEMGEDSLDEVGGLDACDDAQRPATHGTVLDIEMEDSVEALHPAHGGNEPAAIPARSGCADRAPSWRRRCGIEAAIENDFLIREDDYEAEMNYFTRPFSSLQSLARARMRGTQ